AQTTPRIVHRMVSHAGAIVIVGGATPRGGEMLSLVETVTFPVDGSPAIVTPDPTINTGDNAPRAETRTGGHGGPRSSNPQGVNKQGPEGMPSPHAPKGEEPKAEPKPAPQANADQNAAAQAAPAVAGDKLAIQ